MALSPNIDALATRIANYLRDSIRPRLVLAGGTAGQVLAKNSTTDYDIKWVNPTAGSSLAYYQKIDTFTSSGTWTKPAGALRVDVFGQAPGGGGASGSLQASGTVSRGGGGGGAGGRFEHSYNAADVPATVAVSMGAVGAGGASVTTSNTLGNSGGTAGNLFWGAASDRNCLVAYGGGGGFATTSSSAGAGTVPTSTTAPGSSSNTTGNAAQTRTSGAIGATGGGAGASQTATPGNYSGGYIINASSMDFTTSGGSVGVGSSKTNAVAPTISAGYSYGICGYGGGGGWSNSDGTAGAGSAGYRGGGGAGGGAGLNGNVSGKGGDGGGGVLVVVTTGVA